MQNSRTRETDGEEEGGGEERNSAPPTGTFEAGGSLTRFVPLPTHPHPPRWLVVSRTLATFAFLGERVTRCRSRKGAIVFHEIQAPFARGKLFGL